MSMSILDQFFSISDRRGLARWCVYRDQQRELKLREREVIALEKLVNLTKKRN